MRAKITKRVVAGLAPEAMVWDTEIPGFAVRRRTAAGRASFVLQYRHRRRLRWLTLGRFPKIGVEKARKLAQLRLGELAGGSDPAVARERARSVATLQEYSVRYLSECSATKKKPGSHANDQRYLRTYVNPRLGRERLDAIDTGMVSRFHHSLSETPTTANRCLALLSHMFTMAARWHLLPPGSNPCTLVERFREVPHERYLTEGELARAGAALEAATERAPYMSAAVRLLVLTGARPDEIASLRWSWVDLRHELLQIPDSKTGRKVIRLGGAAAILRGLPRAARNPHVFPGHRRRSHVLPGSVSHWWRKIANKAGLKDVRLYDLRHTFASTVAAQGHGLPAIGALLGHKRQETTARYVHLVGNPVMDAIATKATEQLTAALAGKR